MTVPMLVCLGAWTPSAVAPKQLVRTAHIVDERDRPIASAIVELRVRDRRYSQLTDSAGLATFVFASNDRRAYLAVRSVGYAPFADSVNWRIGNDTVVVRLASVVAELTGVTVREQAPPVARLAGVDLRIANGTPSAAITRADIERRNPVALSVTLRSVAGIRLSNASGATTIVATRGTKMVNFRPVPCVMRVSLDGVVVSAGMDIDQVPVTDVHAIEVYFGPSRIPPEFGSMRSDAWCGLVAIWTRGGTGA